MPELCPRCSDSLITGKLYCPNCGLALPSAPDRIPIDVYVEAKVAQAVAKRVYNQASLVREIGDKAEDLVWGRIKKYSWTVAILGVALGAFGVYSIGDAKSKIVNEAKARLEPVIAETEKRVQSAQSKIGASEHDIEGLRTKLNETSALADKQKERLSLQGGEIENKLQEVQASSQKANLLSSGFQKMTTEYENRLNAMQQRADHTSAKLDDMERSFQTRIVAVTRQIDDVSIHQAFPGLGRKTYVTYNDQPWRSPSEKKPNEKWVNIFVDVTGPPENLPSVDELKNLQEALRKMNYTPLLGRFGVNGPYQAGYGSLGGGGNSSGVFYFKPSGKSDAETVGKLIAIILHRPAPAVKYVDPAGSEQIRKLILQGSGLDVQIFFGY